MTFGVLLALFYLLVRIGASTESQCAPVRLNQIISYAISIKKSLTRSRNDGAQRTSVKLDIVTRKSASYLYIS